MILHPGILALLSGSAITLMVMLTACLIAVRILRHWDSNSCSEVQLLLERKTWLLSTLLNYAVGFQLLSLVLFVATAEDIHTLFIGAMCATGALNANLIGWLVLLLKVFLLFAGAIWIVLNHLDQSTEETPLVKAKYRALFFLTPLVAADLYLQWNYFTGLQPEVITSCCGSLFSSQGDSVASDLIAMPVAQAIILFVTSGCFYLVALFLCYRYKTAWLRYLLFAAAVVMFFVSLGAVVSFISLYIYQLPSHHCPFDMLQGHYYYLGYPLYAGLFVATLCGVLPGICQPFKQVESLAVEIGSNEKLWLICAFCGYLIFLLIPAWKIVFSPFELFIL